MNKLFLLLFLGACSSVPAPVPLVPQVVKQTQYIIEIPPAELLSLPQPVENINPDTATQATVSEWLVNKELYTKSLENKLIGISKFFKDTQTSLDAKAIIENKNSMDSALKEQSTEHADANKKSVINK